jgi:hypothetical protein
MREDTWDIYVFAIIDGDHGDHPGGRVSKPCKMKLIVESS